MPDYVPHAKPPEITAETRALWAASEARAETMKQARETLASTGNYGDQELAKMDFADLQAALGHQETQEAKEYLVGTGRWGKGEVDRMTGEQVKEAVATYAENQLMGADSAVRPEFTAEAIRAGTKFADVQEAKEYLVGTGRWGKGEVDRMTGEQVKEAVATYAENQLMGADSAVRPEFTAEAIRAGTKFADVQEAKEYLVGTLGWSESDVARLSAEDVRGVLHLAALAALEGDEPVGSDISGSGGSRGPGRDSAKGSGSGAGVAEHGHQSDPFASDLVTSGFLDTSIRNTELSGTTGGNDAGAGATDSSGASSPSDNEHQGAGSAPDDDSQYYLMDGTLESADPSLNGQHVKVYEDLATGIRYAVTDDGQRIPIVSATDDAGSEVRVPDGGSTTIGADGGGVEGDEATDTGGSDDGGDDASGDDTSSGDDDGGDDDGGEDEQATEESPDVGTTPTDDYVDPKVQRVVDIGRSFGIDPFGMGPTDTGDGHTDPSDHDSGLVVGGELVDVKHALLVDPVDPELDVRRGAVPDLGRPDSGVIDPSDDDMSGPRAMGPEDDPFADLQPPLEPQAPDEIGDAATHPVHDVAGLLHDLDVEVTRPGAVMDFDELGD